MTEPGAQISITSTDSGIAVSGDIDAHTAPDVAAAISKSSVDRLVIDLAGVDFVDSSGLRVFIEAHQTRGDEGRSLVLANPSPVVRRLLDIAGVDTYLEIVDPASG